MQNATGFAAAEPDSGGHLGGGSFYRESLLHRGLFRFQKDDFLMAQYRI